MKIIFIKIFSIVLIFTLLFSLNTKLFEKTGAFLNHKQNATSEAVEFLIPTYGLEYTLINSGEYSGLYEVSIGSATSNKIIIGPRYNGISVVRIANAGFQNQQNIEEVIIRGSSLKYIPNSAFRGASNLKTVCIPESVEEIGPLAFRDAINLRELMFSGATPPARIFNNAFQNTAIKDGNGVIRIFEDAKNSFIDDNFFKDKSIRSTLRTPDKKCPKEKTIQFKDIETDDYLNKDIWEKNELGIESSWGLLFIENFNVEYTIKTEAQLSEGVSGGYGVFFETSINNNDEESGYILQFDRGFGGIIIRKRVNGKEEQAPIFVLTNKENSLIPESKRDEWWTLKHQIEIRVEANGEYKKVSAYINNELLFENFLLDTTTSFLNNWTGLRAWTTSTTFFSLEIS
jgi:hypothetical protein